MADKTHISWTDATWNPITGCSIVSPGCTNCYAMKLAGGRLPARWKRPRRIFVCAHGDLFHENVPDEWIDKVFAMMAISPQHQFQVLTKRAKRMRKYLSRYPDQLREFWELALPDGHKPEEDFEHIANLQMPIPNVWLGVSAEDQERADERIPYLLITPAAAHFISAEPLLGAIDLELLHYDGITNINALTGEHGIKQPWKGQCGKLDWVIAGGESGNGTDKFRECDPDWVRYLRDQCARNRTPFFFKQWGGRTSKAGGNLLDGRLHEEYPLTKPLKW